MSKRGTLKALGAAFAVTVIASATAAHAGIKCRVTVAKQSANVTAAIAKVLTKCEAGVHAGKIPGPCPDTAGATKIAATKSKLKAAIQKACATSTGEFTFGRCPNETGADSNDCGSILIQDKSTEADCLSCLADHNATELVHRVLYGSLTTGGPKAVTKCQAVVDKATLGFYAASVKIAVGCQAALLAKKVTSCPDSVATLKLAASESKKVAAITKACCGLDGVCGGATCSATLAPKVMCDGGANDGAPCSADSACPGGTCANNPFFCAGGVNTGNDCSTDSECPGGKCFGGAANAPCEANRDCGRCRGGTQPGKPCSANGQCQNSPANCDVSEPKRCVSGPNDGKVCTTDSECPTGTCSATCVSGANAGAACTVNSECPGSLCSTGTCTGGSKDGEACNVNSDCPAIAAGTCVGNGSVCQGGANAGAACSSDSACPGSTCGNICGGVDDLSPSNTVGLPVPCPGLTLGGAAIVQTGVTGVSLLDCVDTQANERAQCQSAAGASFGYDGVLPPFCTDNPVTCAISGGTQHVTVNLTGTLPSVCVGGANSGKTCTVGSQCPGGACGSGLGGISISLGYKGIAFPGSGDVSASPRIVNDQFGVNAYSDGDDALILTSATTNDVGLLTAGTLYEVTFDKCGTTPTPGGNFGCVVRSASDGNGVDVQDGVTCSVTVP
jgi:hypothetical protein